MGLVYKHALHFWLYPGAGAASLDTTRGLRETQTKTNHGLATRLVVARERYVVGNDVPFEIVPDPVVHVWGRVPYVHPRLARPSLDARSQERANFDVVMRH